VGSKRTVEQGRGFLKREVGGKRYKMGEEGDDIKGQALFTTPTPYTVYCYSALARQSF
jgi:hypothetical protein